MTEIHRTTLVERLSDPRPVVAVGTLAWVLATVVVLLAGEPWSGALPVCYAGTALGVLGFGVFLVQRSAARRGKRGAQRGLD
ncbi:DUF2530 domain-containing protein [Rhodococcus spongiicola]|uniref:DUF2530 domain-containing protein n=1 Tax=Rhodococcus spongiicola TaxID=2487352 RepID=A0A438B644_9NOCA|nr:DUF2530 domain-containing protein [Rhodococcus spongiicola]RVW06423.1 DUF2530 domain-containing protein [Rhodococcus spongiicola]